MAAKLLREAKGCTDTGDTRSGTGAGGSTCPAAAPELLQAGTAAFLTSLLAAYPNGPTSRKQLVAWAEGAMAFLEEHRNLQRQQRQAAAAIADALAAGAAARAAALAAEKAASAAAKAAKGSSKGADDADDDEGDEEGPEDVVAELLRAGLLSGGGGSGGGGKGGGSSSGSGSSRTKRHRGGGLGRHLAAKLSGGDGTSAIRLGSSDDIAVISIDGDVELDGDGGEDGDGGGDGGDVDFGNGTVELPQLPANFTGLQYGGLPLVRRVLLAQLLLGWMTDLHSEMMGTPHLALELSQVVPLLYDIHVESVAQRSLIEYFHISKAGGTSWAKAASANNCRNARGTAARLPKFDDECRWINGTLMRALGLPIVTQTGHRQVCSRFDVPERMSPITDCEGRWRFMLSRGYQYVANEYTLMGGLHDMYGTHICPQFVNVISIREPLARLSSNIKYMLLRLHTVLFRKPPFVKMFNKIFCDASSAVWEAFAPPVADNYNIRTMVGELGFHAPLYGIGEAHETLAKQLLLQYDLVLDLNAGDTAADLVMKDGLGWRKSLAEVHVWSSEKLAQQSGLDLEKSCPVGDIKRLLEKQEYDQRWYSFGRALSRLDQLFLAAASKLGLKPWPKDWGQQQQQQRQLQQRQLLPRGGGSSAAAADDAGAASASASSAVPFRCGLVGASELLLPPQGALAEAGY